MNHYYADFHARDSIERLHGEADRARRAAQAPGRRRAHRPTGRAVMRTLRSVVLVVVAFIMGAVVALPADAGRGFTDRIEDVDSILAVAFPDDYPVGSVMRAECAFVQRVQLPDGSATETLSCDLSVEPLMVPELQGVAPTSALSYGGGSCEWMSEYWFAKKGAIVFAESYRVVVTPAGKVYATSTYPAEPLDCP